MNDTDRILIIGIGNDYRSDDAAGLIAVRKLKKLPLNNVDVIESNGDGAGLIDSWAGRNKVILIDAVLSGAAPGTIHRLEAESSSLPSDFYKFSTHLFSIPQAIYLSASLGRLPENLVIFGIEGASFKAADGLSEEVEEAINNIEQLVQKEIINFQRKEKEKFLNG
ncbi:MAG TPA: hydrogenase maturation protease [Ignavibacteria bacterium]|jgi:hydrogenase maturation protease